jgi:hypothetical protein
VNKDEVMLILELIIIQLKRVDLGGLLSETDREPVSKRADGGEGLV